MEKHQHVQRNLKEIFANNFLGGIAWGLGGTIGLFVGAAILGFILSKIDLIPVIGTFVSDIYNFVLQKNPRLIQ